MSQTLSWHPFQETVFVYCLGHLVILIIIFVLIPYQNKIVQSLCQDSRSPACVLPGSVWLAQHVLLYVDTGFMAWSQRFCATLPLFTINQLLFTFDQDFICRYKFPYKVSLISLNIVYSLKTLHCLTMTITACNIYHYCFLLLYRLNLIHADRQLLDKLPIIC